MIDNPVEKFSAIFHQNSKSPVFLRLAENEIKEENFEKAIEILESALNENPDYAAIYFLLGKAYSGKGDFRTALRSFRKGSELIKSEKTFQYYLKQIEFQKRKLDDNSSSNLKISSSDYTNLLDNFSGAKNTNVNKVRTDIDDNMVSETLAKIYLSQNETNEAVKIYEKLIKKYPLKKLYFEAKIAEITSGLK